MSGSLLKKLGVITTLLVAVWILYLYRQVPHGQVPFAKAMDAAERIRMQQGSGTIELRKESGHWKVGASAGPYFTADESLVNTLTSSLMNLQVEDEISDRADRAAEYEVTLESGTHVTVFGVKNSTLGEGLFGKQAPDFAHIYFRYVDKSNVYLARGLIRGELGKTEVNAWRSRQMIDLPEETIQGIMIEGKGFKTDLVRESTNTWTVNGKPADPSPVNALIGTIAHLRADEFVDQVATPALNFEGLAFVRITVKGSDTTVVLSLGAPDTKTKRYPASLGKEWGIAWLFDSKAASLLLKPSAFKLKQ